MVRFYNVRLAKVRRVRCRSAFASAVMVMTVQQKANFPTHLLADLPSQLIPLELLAALLLVLLGDIIKNS